MWHVACTLIMVPKSHVEELNEQLPHGAASVSPALAITWSNGARHALVSASRLNFNIAEGRAERNHMQLGDCLRKQSDINSGYQPSTRCWISRRVSPAVTLLFADRCFSRRPLAPRLDCGCAKSPMEQMEPQRENNNKFTGCIFKYAL